MMRALWVTLPLLAGALLYALPIARTPQWLRHHGADALWGFALGAALSLLWRDARGATARAWLALGAVLAVAVELAQLVRVIPGTFDPIDLVAQAAAYALAVALVHLLPAQPIRRAV